jgi:hypothetical protein
MLWQQATFHLARQQGRLRRCGSRSVQWGAFSDVLVA